MEYSVSSEERKYLRELAKKQLELSKLPIMQERQEHWYANNELRSDKPVIVVEAGPFRDELIPSIRCTSEIGKQLETEMLFNIANHELINDDKVMPDFIPVNRHINMKELDMDRIIHRAKDSHGKELGYSSELLIKDLKEDFRLLKKSVYSYDDKGTKEHFDFVQDLLGDILETKITNNTLLWFMSFTARSVNIMGLERLMYSMMDYPEETVKLFDFILEDSFEYMDWQEENNLLTLDNDNCRAGSGSYGFTHELPTEQCKETGKITTKDIWGNMNSQESVGISPSMYKEFIFPIYEKAAKRFGQVYYGCCEPVHEIWEPCVSKLANLRKVSISPWCNEEYMGEALRGTNVIYSRKPSPNYLGVGSFDEAAFTEYMKKTMKAARGCHAEILFRDVYTLTDDNKKAGKAVEIVRRLIENMWG